jgi:hypothetical protein
MFAPQLSAMYVSRVIGTFADRIQSRRGSKSTAQTLFSADRAAYGAVAGAARPNSAVFSNTQIAAAWAASRHHIGVARREQDFSLMSAHRRFRRAL